MKKFIAIFSVILFASFYNANAQNFNNNPIVFVENGIEYAVFENGEFDFNVIRSTRNNNININLSNLNLSYNSGNRQNNQITRNRYGDIIKINRTPIFYNNNGQVNQIGSVNIFYNRYGDVKRVGNLYISYNNNNANCRGFVNNNNYRYRPVYRNYRTPVTHHHAYTYYGKRNNSYNNNTRNKYNRKNNQYTYKNNNKRKNNNRNNNYQSNKKSNTKIIIKPRTSEKSYSYTDTNQSSRRR